MGTLELELFLGSRERWWRRWSRSMRILTEIQAVVCQRSTVLLSETSRFETIPIHLVRVLKAAIRFYAQMMTRSVLGEPIVGPTRTAQSPECRLERELPSVFELRQQLLALFAFGARDLLFQPNYLGLYCLKSLDGLDKPIFFGVGWLRNRI